MIRQDDIAPLLSSVRSAIAEAFRPELQTDKARALADAALMVLDRMLTDIRGGDALAIGQLAAWQEIRDTCFAAAATAQTTAGHVAPGFLGTFGRLQDEVGDIQRRLDAKLGLQPLIDRLAAGNAGATAWFNKAVNALNTLYEASQPVIPGTAAADATPNTTSGLDRLRSSLNGYLHRRFPTLPDAPVTELRILSGGNSKQTLLLAMVPNEVLPPRVVLRLDIANSITGTSVRDEYPYIEKAWAAGVKTPKPLLLETDTAILGGRFMLMEEMAQVVPSGTYFPEDRLREPSRVGPDFGKEIATTLAHLHGRTCSNEASAAPDYVKITRDASAAWSNLSPKAPVSLTMDLSLAWMLSHPPKAGRPCTIVHGDFGSHNVLVRDGKLAAVVDWELAYIGDPADDLAQVRMMLLPGIMDWKDFVNEYIAAGGDPRACEEASVAWFCVSLFVKHGLFFAAMRNTFLRGERTDIGAASLVTYYTERIFQYQARALRIAVASQH